MGRERERARTPQSDRERRGPTPFRGSAERAELLALYREADALFAGASCDASTDCCRFGVTGRQPYPTAVELAEVALALRDAGGGSALARRPAPEGRRALPLAERRCPLLSDEGRCRIYASRPFGCRTFFCDRATLGGKYPRNATLRIGRALLDLSARVAPADPGPRPLEAALVSLRKQIG